MASTVTEVQRVPQAPRVLLETLENRELLASPARLALTD